MSGRRRSSKLAPPNHDDVSTKVDVLKGDSVPLEIPGDAQHVFHTPIFAVSLRQVGSIRDFATVHHPGAVAIVAHDDECVYLTQQYRPAVDRKVIELPAGTREEGEDPVQTADRELQEEVGKHARNLNLIATFLSSPGYTDEKVMIFRGWNLEDVKAEGDEDEEIEVIQWPLDNLEGAIAVAITAKTIIGLSMLRDALRWPGNPKRRRQCVVRHNS